MKRHVSGFPAARAAICIWMVLLLCVSAAAVAEAPASALAEKLAAAEGVLRVERVEGNRSAWMPEKYIVTVEQQLDWKHPEAGSFPQRVELGLHPGALVNVLETNGYQLFDDKLPTDDQPEVCSLLGANLIKVEHRFSGQSFPEGMTTRSTKGWENLTTENEAGDYHHIFEIFSRVLGGQWVAYGRSRGGRACVDYARFYPGEMKGYVAYVAPNCRGLIDGRYMEYVNTAVGDKAFGREQAAAFRETVEAFQVACMKDRAQLEQPLWEAMKDGGYGFPGWVTKERLFDLAVLEFQSSIWMSGGPVSEIEEVLALPEGTERTDAFFALLQKYGDPSSYSADHAGFAYYSGALINEGFYGLDFSYLRAALGKAGLEDRLRLTPEEERDFFENVVLEDDQKASFTFVPGEYEALDAFAKTTDLPIVLIGGDLDPWSAMYIDGGDNPNFRRFILVGAGHFAQIEGFAPEIREEIKGTILSWVK